MTRVKTAAQRAQLVARWRASQFGQAAFTRGFRFIRARSGIGSGRPRPRRRSARIRVSCRCRCSMPPASVAAAGRWA